MLPMRVLGKGLLPGLLEERGVEGVTQDHVATGGRERGLKHCNNNTAEPLYNSFGAIIKGGLVAINPLIAIDAIWRQN